MELICKNNLWDIGYNLKDQKDIITFVFSISKNFKKNLNDDVFWRNWVLLNLNHIDLYLLYPIDDNESRWFNTFKKIALLKNGNPFTSLLSNQVGATFYYRVTQTKDSISFHFFHEKKKIELKHFSIILCCKSFKSHCLFYGTLNALEKRLKIEIYDKFGKIVYELLDFKLMHTKGIPNFQNNDTRISIDEKNDKIEIQDEKTALIFNVSTKRLLISKHGSDITVYDSYSNGYCKHADYRTNGHEPIIFLGEDSFLIKSSTGWIYYNTIFSKIEFNIVPVRSFLDGLLFWRLEDPNVLYFITNDKWRKIWKVSGTNKIFITPFKSDQIYDFSKYV